MKLTLYAAILVIATSCVNNNKDWYLVKKLDDRTYIISEPYSSQINSSVLIIGNNEAILFDSGTGENDEKSIVQITDSLTKVPITLLLSHFHFDHIGNVNYFSTIGLPDIQFLKNRLSADSLMHLTKADILSHDTTTLKISRYFPLEQEIDLGNRRIKILHTPGHSNESISIIDSENRYIFTGDLVYNDLLLVDDCRSYIQSINHILENSAAGYRVFGAHGKPEVDYAQLANIKHVISRYLIDEDPLEPIHQINLFGTTKNVYQVKNIRFIVDYTDVLKK